VQEEQMLKEATKEAEAARRRADRKRLVRMRLTELGVKARTRVGEDAFVVGTLELMKLLDLKEQVTLEGRKS
jgi:hypothetical protein